MKINIVRDDRGKVVATFENPSEHGGPAVKPILKHGHSIHEVDVAEDYKSNLAELYRHHSRPRH